MSDFSLQSEAKQFNLLENEIEFIKKYAIKSGIDPIRALLNKDFFKIIENEYKKEKNINRSFLYEIKKKLNFISPIDVSLEDTRDIQIGTKAKFFITPETFTPITLEKNRDNYKLWIVESHRNMDIVYKGVEGDIVFEDEYKRVYRFKTKILNDFSFINKIIQTPHTDEIKILNRRNEIRIDTNIKAFVRKCIFKENTKSEIATIENISLQGVRLFFDKKINIKKFERLWVEAKIENRYIKMLIKVIYQSQNQRYGAVIEDISLEDRRALERFIKKSLKSQRSRF